ncbi:MAG: flippase-like domain-containing protein [Magnetococcus sp. YQC-5]
MPLQNPKEVLVLTILKICLASGLLYWLAHEYQLALSSVSDAFFTWSQGVILLSLLGHFSCQIFRWLLLLRLQEIQLSWAVGTRLFFIGQFFLITSLGAVGGEVARGYYVIKHSGSAKLAGASTVVADRMIGLFTYLLIGGISFLVLWGGGGLPESLLGMGWVILSLLLGMVLLFLLAGSSIGQRLLHALLPNSWCELLQRILKAFHPAQKSVQWAMGLSLLANFWHLLAFMAAGRALNVPLGWGDVFLALPLVVLANSLPLPLGGLGAGETAAQLLLMQLGVPNGAMIMLFMRITQWSLLVPLGLFCYLTERDPSGMAVKREPNLD